MYAKANVTMNKRGHEKAASESYLKKKETAEKPNRKLAISLK